ncbi:MAG: sulfotransferase [Candidatus Nealsonbacteria bacterium]|nr:sulfotransferase [Candidatus Nealsonbacteria bacterium]
MRPLFGRLFGQDCYANIVREKGVTETTCFPAYRQGEIRAMTTQVMAPWSNERKPQMYEEAIFLMGMARSGTSWVGQIFDSCPEVRYRFQPLFAYQFRERDFSKELLREIYLSRDPFVCQRNLAEFLANEQDYAPFTNVDDPTTMVLKMIRFHHLVERIIEDSAVVYLVRHPCGAINSWLNSPECKVRDNPEEWRTGEKKKEGERNRSGIREYCGFDDWKTVTLDYLRLAERFPDRCRIQSYEAMVDDTLGETQALFDWCDIPFTEQTQQFIELSRRSHSDDPYAVLKDSRRVSKQWERQLEPQIRDVIIGEVTGTPLERFV